MGKNLLQRFLSMFTDGLIGFEVIALLGGTIAVICGLVQLKDKYSRKGGVFTLVMGIFYSVMFFITSNGYATIGSIIICAVGSVVLNILCWKKLCRLSAKEVFSWLQGYVLLFFPAVFIGIVFEDSSSIPSFVVWQFIVLIVSLLLGVFVLISENISGSRSHDRDPVEDITDDMNNVDIIWMDD